MRKIGVLGGTFNPIHLGHLMLGEWALDAVGLDQVWIIPTGISYMKDQGEIATAENRLRMASLATESNPHFRCLDIEIRRRERTYSYETMESLHESHPEDMFFFILGADCLFTIETWKNPERIFQSCTVVAAVRDDTALSAMEEKRLALEQRFQGRILLLPFIRISLSSTEIRQRIRNGQSIRYMVPDNVLSYIEEKRLYREERV